MHEIEALLAGVHEGEGPVAILVAALDLPAHVVAADDAEFLHRVCPGGMAVPVAETDDVRRGGRAS